jgi:hypothetical protein
MRLYRWKSQKLKMAHNSSRLDPKKDKLIYWAKHLGNGRAVLMFEAIFDGCIVQSYEVGSPAPLEIVKQQERKVDI